MKGLELKSINSESNKQLINKNIYNKLLEVRMDEILNMSKEIDYGNLVYNFKGSTPSINFTIFGGQYLYQSKEITKNVCNNIIKSL